MTKDNKIAIFVENRLYKRFKSTVDKRYNDPYVKELFTEFVSNTLNDALDKA